MQAALSASIEPSEQFSLVVEAENVESEYVTAATNAVITTLLSQIYAPVLACKVTLFAFKPHEENSSYAAFYAVAKEAIEQLLGVAPNTVNNIAW
jgi:translation elongation factor EF-G